MSASAGLVGRVSEVEHEIGASGTLTLHVPDGDVAIRGVEGSVVRLRDVSGREPNLSVVRAAGSLEVSVGELPSGNGPRWSFFGRPHRVSLEAEVPHGARLQVEVASADVRVIALDGEQGYRSVSGELELLEAGGAINVDGVSCDVTIVARSVVAVRAHTVSGDLRLRGAAVRLLEVDTMSGDVRIEAPLLGGSHRIATVSGDALLVGVEGVTVEASTISGDLATDLPHRISGGRGRRTMVVGSGAARLAFRSMSGDLDLVRGRSSAEVPTDTAPGAPDDDRLAAARLALLQALERGEIDVAEAGRRLATLEEESHA